MLQRANKFSPWSLSYIRNMVNVDGVSQGGTSHNGGFMARSSLAVWERVNGLLLACRFHHYNRPLLSLPSSWHHIMSLITSKGCSLSLFSDLLLLKIFLFTSGQNTVFASSFLPNCYFPVPFSAFLLTSSLWALPKVYSSVHCSCLLMTCFLET